MSFFPWKKDKKDKKDKNKGNDKTLTPSATVRGKGDVAGINEGKSFSITYTFMVFLHEAVLKELGQLLCYDCLD